MAADNTVLVITGGAPLDDVAVRAAAGAEPVCRRRRRSRPCLGRRDPARRAGRRSRLDLARRSRLGERRTSTVERHPADKAATDTELALSCAAAMKPDRIVLLAGRGDRLDHGIAALGALGGDSTGGRSGRRGLVGFRPRDRRPPRSRRRGDPSGRHDVLAARPARRLPRCDRHRLALATRRRRSGADGRSRRIQRGCRTTVPRRGRRQVS